MSDTIGTARMKRIVRNLLLTAFLLTPAVLVAILLWAIRAPTTLPPPNQGANPAHHQTGPATGAR